MTTLELNDEQTRFLHELLQVTLADMSVEIAGTDRKEYRDEIKQERELLQEIAAKLEQAR